MSLEIATRQVDTIHILDLKGRIVAGPEVAALRAAVSDAIAAGQRAVLLEMGRVAYVDSSGLGAMVSAASSMKSAGGVIKLLNPDDRHLELLVMTKLYMVFEIFQDERDAVNSFYPDRMVKRFDVLAFVKARKA